MIRRFILLSASLATLLPGVGVADSAADRGAIVTATPGCVAFWDFVKREPGGEGRFLARVPTGATNEFALDAVNYVRDGWGRGRSATYADFPLLGRGPFGQAVRICPEKDPDFRPLLCVPRSRLHDSALDIKGQGQSVSVVVWAVRESGNHALAGIWHEGTDLATGPAGAGLKRERGQRQYALFAGLEFPGSACGHISENGAGSFLSPYAQHKAYSPAVAPMVSADAPAETLDAGWRCWAMTFSAERHEITSWLDGQAGDRWLSAAENKSLFQVRSNAWFHGWKRRQSGAAYPEYPEDQVYDPPEGTPVSVRVLAAAPAERVELREFAYTRVKVRLVAAAEGGFREAGRELVAIRLNPWWYPHGIYAPKDASSGGPFSIGRVIHSGRSVGFTGWIGGVAVFNRALTPAELDRLSAIDRLGPIQAASPQPH